MTLRDDDEQNHLRQLCFHRDFNYDRRSGNREQSAGQAVLQLRRVGHAKRCAGTLVPVELQALKVLTYLVQHSDRMISKQDYEDYIEELRKRGITKEPILTDWPETVRNAIARGEQPKCRCSVPGCDGPCAPGFSFCFDPYKQPGWAWACADHKEAIRHVKDRLNGQRVFRDLAGPRSSDPERVKRRRAILAARKKYHGQRNYIENVCRDLQRQRINMPQRWLDQWERKDLPFETCDWFVAYKAPAAKPKIQKFISQTCPAMTVRVSTSPFRRARSDSKENSFGVSSRRLPARRARC